jgi:hypothetical protein
LRCELASRAKIAGTVSRKHSEATRAFARATRLRCHLCAAFCAGGARRAGKFDSTMIFHRAIRVAIAGTVTTKTIQAPTVAARTHTATRCVSITAGATRAPSSRLSRKPSFAMLE